MQNMSENKGLWVLPDGVNELTPETAIPLEQLRRKILDQFSAWGYELVIPPLFEFLDSLLTGSGHEMALETIKITDQVSGKMMGLRADMTPQIARIEAHERQGNAPDRLCYVGSVGKARMQKMMSNRSPIQIGAELYGHAGLASDIEIVRLMLATLEVASIKNVTLDLGHVGIFRALVQEANLDENQECQLVEALQRKSATDLNDLLDVFSVPEKIAKMMLALISLHGGVDVITQARQVLDISIKPIAKALDDLELLADVGLDVHIMHFDLSELRGYAYHTGLVFAAYVESIGVSVAKGGRYDDIGKAFGRTRAATGFSADLLTLTKLTKLSAQTYMPQRIFAPAEQDADLQTKITLLRANGETVVEALPEQEGGKEEMGCSHELVQHNGAWEVVSCK